MVELNLNHKTKTEMADTINLVSSTLVSDYIENFKLTYLVSNSNIDINEDKIFSYNKTLLDILLKDRTTGNNIIWATSDYENLGSSYISNMEVFSSLIIGNKNKIIRPRASKTKNEQLNRTRDKAEVFTPSWVCNAQNNLIDEEWFGYSNVFNITQDKHWKTNDTKIMFPNDKEHSWKKYVDSRRLEITCGEAPYLVSRYDTVSGQYIPVKDRIGLLDRKLRVVNENTNTLDEWYRWTIRAFQSVYGFEYQGDSLLLARENMLYTFIDNMKYKFNLIPNIKQLQTIATIISWNIWQMDGLTYTVPMCDMREKKEQLSFFEKDYSPKYCKIKDWRAKKIITFKSLVENL